MKKTFIKHLSLLLVIIMTFSIFTTSCDWLKGIGGGGWTPPSDEYTIPKEEGHNQLTFYWNHGGYSSYDVCDIWIWYEGGGTDGLIPTDEGWTRLEHHGLTGGEYDGSGY